MGNAWGDLPESTGGPSIGLIGTTTHNAPGPLVHGDGGALSFDGVDGCGVVELDLTEESAITVEFWLKWDEYAANDDLGLEFSANFNVFTGGFLIDPNNGSGKWGVGIGDSGGRRNNAFFAAPSAGVWHHYAFVLDTTAEAAKQVTPYVDGVPVAYTKTHSGTGQGNFLKAILNVMSRNSASLFGAGDMCHLAIYSGGLSAEEIAAHFAAGEEEGTVDVEPEGEGEEEEGGSGSGSGSRGPNAKPPFAPLKTSYDSIVSTRTAIRAAANNPGNAGKVIAIKGGTYSTLDFRGSGGHPPTMFGPPSGIVTFIPLPGHEVKIKGVEKRWTRNIRFEGIKWLEGGVECVSADDFSNPAPFDPGEEFHNQNIQFYGCEWIGGAFNCFYGQAWTDDLFFEGCYFHGTACPEGKDVGYGIQWSGGNGLNKNLTIRRCFFEDFANDMIQISSAEGIVIDRCELGFQERDNPSSHPDVIQLFGVKDVEITNCYVHDGGFEQGLFFEYGWSGTCVIQNNLLLGSTTKKLWWTGNVVASGSILVDSNTVWDSNGTYIQAKGSAAFTVTNNLFDKYDVEHPEVIAEEDGNQIGGDPEFGLNHESEAFPQGYRLPSEVWWGKTPSRIAVTRELPPDKLAVRIADRRTGQTIARWAEDEPKAENVVANLRKNGEMPGGHKEMTCSLARDPRVDYPDLGIYNDVFVEQSGGENVWEGRLDKKPKSDGERLLIEPAAVGHQAALQDRKALRLGFINAELAKWGDPSTARREALRKALVQLVAAVSTGFSSADLKAAAAAIIMDFTNVEAAAETYSRGGESVFDSGGVDIGGVLYDYRQLTEFSEDSAWYTTMALGTGDDFSTSIIGTDHNRTTALQREVSSGGKAGYRYARATDLRTPTGTSASLLDITSWQNLRPIGNHGLTLQGTWPDVGFTSGQMLRYAIPLYSYLEATEESVEDDGYVIPHAWFSDPGMLAQVVQELTKYELLDWFVMHGKLFEQRIPGTYGGRWKVPVGASELKQTGEDGSRYWDRIVGRYNDVDGSTRTVGYPGSGADFESAALQITDPDHPAVKAEIVREDLLDLRGISSPERAAEACERWLRDANELSRSGEATLRRYVMDDKGVERPVSQVQPGDYLLPLGASDESYRKIVLADYDDTTKTCQVTLDAPSEGLQALLERYQAALTPLPLS